MVDLKPYATPRQLEYLEAVDKYGSVRKAATALGVAKSTVTSAVERVTRKATSRADAPEHGLTHPLPDGLKLKKAATYYGKDGEITGQWVSGVEDRDRQQQMMEEAYKAFASELPKAKPTPAPKFATSDILTTYPVGDHHLGMLAWSEETLEDNYDISIAENLLYKATDYLISVSPPSEQGLIVFLGDFMHYDSMIAETPSSHNSLDADGRFPKMVRAAIKSMRYMIQQTLAHHQKVHVIIEIGNHDLSSSIMLMECLSNVYENEPRITIDTSPAHYHYYRFGKVLIGSHHGHGRKPQDLPMVMAADRPDDWGKSEFRFWMTGHVHHKSAKEYHGTEVESFRILAPGDAYASQKGYRDRRQMQSIVYHKNMGEVERHIFNPQRLKEVV
jgi:hypothetical protein